MGGSGSCPVLIRFLNCSNVCPPSGRLCRSGSGVRLGEMNVPAGVANATPPARKFAAFTLPCAPVNGSTQYDGHVWQSLHPDCALTI